jgi:pimeloyl-ACP methyl ester carboxylesterase
MPPDRAKEEDFHTCLDTAILAAPDLRPSHRDQDQDRPRLCALPELYLLATQDKSVLPAVQRHMGAGVDALTVQEINSDHVPQVTQPRELAALIDRWLPYPLRTGPIPR